MTAPGTVRVATELRLVELLGQLDGWTTDPDETGWCVKPWGRGAPESRRQVIVGVPDGAIDPDAIASLHAPSTDAWSVKVWIFCTDLDDGPEAKQAVEDAVNDIADLLAAQPRLDMRPGPRSARLGPWEGPFFDQEDGRSAATAEADLYFVADIERNR